MVASRPRHTRQSEVYCVIHSIDFHCLHEEDICHALAQQVLANFVKRACSFAVLAGPRGIESLHGRCAGAALRHDRT